MDIFHIYYGTAGNSGIYTNEIFNGLNNKYSQLLFVNHYYPFNNKEAKKVFFKYTEKHENNRWKLRSKLIRKLLRMLELFKGYFIVLKDVQKHKPKLINYNLINLPGCNLLFNLVRLISPNTKIMVTCHDVKAFSSTSLINYHKVYKKADYLLVHNEISSKVLKNEFNIEDEKIIEHDFPLMDLGTLSVDKSYSAKSDTIIKFLFIGSIRKEKGVSLLIDAWSKIGDLPSVQLTIAGQISDEVHLNFDRIQRFKNVELKLDRLNDNEYYKLIKDTDFVIFPYTQIGNSGVLSTIVNMNCIIISSDLEYFIENPYVYNELTFKSGNHEELYSLINKTINLSFEERNQYLVKTREAVEQHKSAFKENIVKSYTKVLKV